MGMFQVGDKVRIKGPAWSDMDVASDQYYWEPRTMDAFLGQTTRITKTKGTDVYEVGADGGTYGWLAKWLEPVTAEESATFERWWKDFCDVHIDNSVGNYELTEAIARQAWNAATEAEKRT